MENIVTVENGELKVSIADIAKFSNVDVNSIKSLINTHKERFNIELVSGSHKEFKSLCLTERETTHLLLYMRNTDEVMDFKDSLVDQFFSMRNIIQSQHEKQLAQKDQEIKKLIKERKYGEMRAGTSQTVTWIIKEYQIDMSANELNNELYKKGMLNREIVEEFRYLAPEMSKGVPIVNVDMTLALVDMLGYDRGIGWVDTNPTLF